MGFFKTTFLVLGGFTVYGSYCAQRLGKNLPQATRKMGYKIGMFYNYMHIQVATISPKRSESTKEIFNLYKQTNQQTTVFTREVNQNFMINKDKLNKAFPKDIMENPYDKFRLKSDTPIDIENKDQVSGSDIIKKTMEERRRLRLKYEEKPGQKLN